MAALTRRAPLALLALLLAASPVMATLVTQPVGLNPGDQYRLAFVTSTVQDGSSANLADYNAFVSSAANTQQQLIDLGTSWAAIVSVSSANNARANTGTGGNDAVPIYLLNGSRLAANSNDLWDGSLDTPLSIQEDGATATGDLNVWTGTNSTGFADDVLGDVLVGAGRRRFGQADQATDGWIAADSERPPRPGDSWSEFRIYGLSDVLTVSTAAIPEPNALLWLSFAGVSVVACKRRRSYRVSDG